jgi:predicted esterase
MFGDPGETAPPEIKIRLRVYPKGFDEQPVARVVPDIVDGWAMGDWLSLDIGAGCDSGVTTVTDVTQPKDTLVHLRLLQPVVIQSNQGRVVPLKLEQRGPLHHSVTQLTVTLAIKRENVQDTAKVDIQLPVRHIKIGDGSPFHFTFASPAPVGDHVPALVSGCTMLPPSSKGDKQQQLPPVLLALHGAGVDYRSEGWIEAMPRIPGMWAILPSGRNEWGGDWHGGSLLDVWAVRDALNPVLQRAGIEVSRETVLIGHSNGGQGAWYSAARYPERIRGVVAVAGYLKIQDYVPYTETTTAHYADPSLVGILNSALAPYNNDLYASNLASVPVLAVHGADDDNVPPRHGRSHAAVVASWAGEANVKFVEVPNVGHVWDGVLRHPTILEFLTNLPRKRTMDEVRDAGFTLATANPDETGAKAGIRIVELAVPGRLARLDVNATQWKDERTGPLDIHGSNVRRIEIIGWSAPESVMSLAWSNRQWRPSIPSRPRTYGPMIRLLASAGPVTIVLGAAATPRQRSLAIRYVHDLRVYHRLDAVIVNDRAALYSVADSSLSPGSVVVLGRPEENEFAKWLIAQEPIC